MPINYSCNGYLATEAGILVDAFEGALKALRLVDRNDPKTLAIARPERRRRNCGDDDTRSREADREQTSTVACCPRSGRRLPEQSAGVGPGAFSCLSVLGQRLFSTASGCHEWLT
jgi:hypothetical protein